LQDKEKVDFNEYAREYEKILDNDLKFFGEHVGYFAEYKVKIVKETLHRSPVKILEYGCGIGLNLRYFRKHFPQVEISGCDISQSSIDVASRQNSGSELFIIDPENLKLRKEKYDLIFVSCVFHHIAPELRAESFSYITNLLKPGGEFYIFEHNPYNPVTRRIVRDCIWDKDAILLKPKETEKLMKDAGLTIIQKKYTLFFPAKLNFVRTVEKLLGNIPVGGQYYIKGMKK